MKREYPHDLQNGPYIEAVETVCPYCHGISTEFLCFDTKKEALDGNSHETHFCYDCQIEFDVATEIPF